MKTFAIFYEAKRVTKIGTKAKKLPEGVEQLPDGTYRGTRYNGDEITYALDPQLKNRHRIDGPAYEDEEWKQWWVNGQLHRIDGPASIEPGYECWWVNGERHRMDGPAVIGTDTDGTNDDHDDEWWVNGKQFTEDDYNDLMQRLSTLTDDSDKEATIAVATMFD